MTRQSGRRLRGNNQNKREEATIVGGKGGTAVANLTGTGRRRAGGANATNTLGIQTLIPEAAINDDLNEINGRPLTEETTARGGRKKNTASQAQAQPSQAQPSQPQTLNPKKEEPQNNNTTGGSEQEEGAAAGELGGAPPATAQVEAGVLYYRNLAFERGETIRLVLPGGVETNAVITSINQTDVWVRREDQGGQKSRVYISHLRQGKAALEKIPLSQDL